MKKLSKKQVVILAVAVLVVIAIVVIIAIVVKNRPNTKTSFEGEKGTQSVELDKVEFSNITKKYESGITRIEADIESNAKKTKNLTIEIILKTEEGKELERLKQVIENIEPGRKKRLQTAILGDYSSIKDIEFRVVEE